MQDLFAWLASPGVGLPAVFLMSLLAATFLPMSSEAVLLGYLAAAPDMFWMAIAAATLGNTLGGLVSFGMGAGAHGIFGRWRARRRARHNESLSEGRGDLSVSKDKLTPSRARAEQWVYKYGPPVLLLSWLPVVGDPLCAVAGWLRLPLWQCVIFMALGKFGRYLVLAWAFLWAINPT